jgi:hypothetical protein
MRKKEKRKIGVCTYCGEIKLLTRDHVIPLCLFKPPYPQNLITVPACEECNNIKSKNDDYLRDYITIDIYGNQNPIAQDIFKNKVLKSFHRNSSILLRDFLTKGQTVPYYSNGGIYLGDLPSVSLDGERIDKTFFNLAQGLFFDHRRQRIPNNYLYKVLRHDPWQFNNLWDTFRQLHINGPRTLGKIFGCAYASAEEDSATTLWLMWFYERVIFSVSITNPDFEENISRQSISQPS